MLTPVANTMESSGFFVLNTFFVILKKGRNREEDKTSITEGFIDNSYNGTTVRACSLSPHKPQNGRM